MPRYEVDGFFSKTKVDDRRKQLNKIIADKSMNVNIDAIDYKDLNN
jgi:hypothetical protein